MRLLKNPWILALMIYLISFVLNAIMIVFLARIKFVSSSVTGIIAGIAVAQLYTHYYKEIMPKMLRLKVVLYHLCIFMGIGILSAYLYGILDIAFLIIFVVLGLVLSAVLYLVLGFGGRIQMKALEKQKK